LQTSEDKRDGWLQWVFPGLGVLAGKTDLASNKSVNITVDVGGVKAETADPSGLASELSTFLGPLLMKYVVDALHLSNQSNQGGVGGTHDSPYATGQGAN